MEQIKGKLLFVSPQIKFREGVVTVDCREISIANDLSPERVEEVVAQFGGTVLGHDSVLFTITLPEERVTEAREALRKAEDKELGPIWQRFGVVI